MALPLLFILAASVIGTGVLSEVPNGSPLDPVIGVAEQVRVTVDPSFSDRLIDKKILAASVRPNAVSIKDDLTRLSARASTPKKQIIAACVTKNICPTPTPKPFVSVR